jgi:DNA polymerase-3 subunit beta
MLRLLIESDDEIIVKLGDNHVQAMLGNIRFTSKLIDGKFPDYQQVIPLMGEHVVIANRMVLRNALARVAILSSEKYRGIRLLAENWLLRIQAHNPEQEEAEEEVEVSYNGGSFEIGFNVTYLLDALGVLAGELVKLSFTDANSSCLIEDPEGGNCKYVVMPMKL